MSNPARRLILALLLALYGGVTAYGPGIHALSGPEPSVACAHSDGNGADHPTNSDDDCLICQFLAQGQWHGVSALAVCLDVARVRPAETLPLVFPPAHHGPSRPRAPPLA